MRVDRFITLRVVRPFRIARQTLNLQPSTLNGSLPILMYHSISEDPETDRSSYYKTCTSPQQFAEHIRWLGENGYRGVTLQDGLAWLDSQPSTLSPQPVAITFDDGFHDFYTEAFPVLESHGFSATMYLPTAFIGEPRRRFGPSTLNSQPSTHRPCLTWTEARELHRAGIEFGSHTVTHPKLMELDWRDIERELCDSKEEIENRLGCAVNSFAYPFAFPPADRDFVVRFSELLGKAGYQTNVTTRIGRVRSGDDPFRLKRLPVNQDDDQALLAAKLDGAYEWLGGFQSWSKKLRRNRKTEFGRVASFGDVFSGLDWRR